MDEKTIALQRELEAAGYTPGSAEFQKVYLEKRIDLCRSRMRVNSCGNCPYHPCDILLEYLLPLKYPAPK